MHYKPIRDEFEHQLNREYRGEEVVKIIQNLKLRNRNYTKRYIFEKYLQGFFLNLRS